MNLPMIRNVKEMEQLINEVGFIPFFKSEIQGFSVEDCTPLELWFADEVEGPWEWREKIVEKGNIAYGKIFNKKTGFISKKWYPDFVNYRRDGYDFDARYDDGLSSYMCKRIVDMFQEKDSMLANEIKGLFGFSKGSPSGFETAMTTLQMQTYITVKSFEYRTNKFGQTYGWGAARYALSESIFGEAFVRSGYGMEPEKSKDLLVEHMIQLFPDSTEKKIAKIIAGGSKA